jgi:hypothetical protein
MKRNILFGAVFFLFVLPNMLRAQVAYQDALQLAALNPVIDSGRVLFPIVNQSNLKAAEILKKYVDKTTYGEIQQAFSKNPYLRLPAVNALSSSPIAGASKMLSSVGGLDVTTIADGIAKFLVERTKAELDVYFFEQFNDFLNNKDYGKDVQVLFPNTHSVMLVAGHEIYNYQQYLQAFREAFANDLSNILLNANTWINLDPVTRTKLVTRIQGLPSYPYIQLIFEIAVEIQQGKHPGDILNELATRVYIRDTWGDFGPVLKVANIFSQSLRSATGERYWISEEEFNKFSDPVFLRIYLGLVYQKSLSIDVNEFTVFLTTLSKTINNAESIIIKFKPILTHADQTLLQLKASNDPGTTGGYVTLLNDLPKILALANKIVMNSDKTPLFKTSDIEFLFTHVSNLVADVRAKAYSAAVIEFSLIIQKIDTTDSNFLKGVIKYGSFMANVATAKTSEEVKQAIEVVALPPGSYRVKRESYGNVSLNGYVGLYGGVEHMPASETPNRGSAGVFAPVGFSFSRGGLKASEKKGGKSVSLFVSVIDLGALASFRFNDDNTAVASNVKLKDIVAPGLYFIYGLGKSPISLGLGAQMGPSLRDVDSGGTASISENYYVRYGAFVAVDIPFFNLYNRKDRK